MSLPRLLLAPLLVLAGCAAGPINDGALGDGGATDDAASSALTVGPTGGRVDRLFFAFHGDTRPPNCDQTSSYPMPIIENIYKMERALGVQFAVDLGDHMYVCNNVMAEAQTQMGMYMSAASLLGKVTFMTMGNHECAGGGYCTTNSGDVNSTVYRQALAPVSRLPYYSVDIATDGGTATLVFIADNSWDPQGEQQKWLEATLTRADAEARYTIVARHHPIDNTQLSNPAIWQIVRAHKYSLFLTGHSHFYRRDTGPDPSGRSLRLGTGGAPLTNGGTFYGFGTVQQGSDGALTVSIYDQATGNVQDSFVVQPQ